MAICYHQRSSIKELFRQGAAIKALVTRTIRFRRNLAKEVQDETKI
jgi:hypothetical protein